MGLSDKIKKQQEVVSEEEIRKEVEQEVVKEQPKNLKTSVELTKDEITMILAKFAQLEFKGVEMELTYNLIVQGDTIQQQVANLNVEDRFILLNSGSASGDGGIVVQTESANGDGVAFAYDDSESRWAFQQGTKLNASASAVAPDAYASAVVTSDDSNYQKNGNIRVEGGEIYIYVE